MAAMFGRVGLRPSIDASADVEVAYRDYTLVLECKRPQELNSVSSNLAKASRQLSRRLPALDRGVGLVALDITKAANPSHVKASISSGAPIEEILSAPSKVIVERLGAEWKLERRTHISAVLMKFSTLLVHGDKYTYAQQLNIVPNPSSDGKVQPILRELTQQMLNGG
jgi:hypothetical protein